MSSTKVTAPCPARARRRPFLVAALYWGALLVDAQSSSPNPGGVRAGARALRGQAVEFKEFVSGGSVQTVLHPCRSYRVIASSSQEDIRARGGGVKWDVGTGELEVSCDHAGGTVWLTSLTSGISMPLAILGSDESNIGAHELDHYALSFNTVEASIGGESGEILLGKRVHSIATLNASNDGSWSRVSILMDRHLEKTHGASISLVSLQKKDEESSCQLRVLGEGGQDVSVEHESAMHSYRIGVSQSHLLDIGMKCDPGSSSDPYELVLTSTGEARRLALVLLAPVKVRRREQEVGAGAFPYMDYVPKDSNCDAPLAGEICFGSGPNLVWTSEQGQIKLNGKPFHLKGTNWFGFESEIGAVHGLTPLETTMEAVMQFLAYNGFNALRVPVSLELALDKEMEILTEWDGYTFSSRKSWAALSELFDVAAHYGILIMLDMHTLQPGVNAPLWYDEIYSADDLLNGWVNLLEMFAGKPNLFAIDLMNEPYEASWGDWVNDTDFHLAIMNLLQGINTRLNLDPAMPNFSNKLIFVTGVTVVNGSWSPWPYFWGGNLEGVRYTPVDCSTFNLEWNQHIVYTPHVYGPSVDPERAIFLDANFPLNMPPIWESQLGFIEDWTGKAVIIGEWGGFYEGEDNLPSRAWLDAFSDWLPQNCLEDTFFWSLNPNSADTGGLFMDDWITPEDGKLAILDKVQPFPTKLKSINADCTCIVFGAYANAACNTEPPTPAPEESPPPTETSPPTETPPPTDFDISQLEEEQSPAEEKDIQADIVKLEPVSGDTANSTTGESAGSEAAGAQGMAFIGTCAAFYTMIIFIASFVALI